MIDDPEIEGAEGPVAQDPVSQGPPPGAEDRLRRLIKARADLLMQPVLDDRGEVVRSPIYEPEEAMRAAIRELGEFAKQPDARAQIRGYTDGTRPALPDGWEYDPNERITSQKTIQEQEDLRAATEFREQHPVRAGLYDYVVDPAQRLLTAGPQAVVDVATGIPNFFGAEIPAVNLRAITKAAMRGFSGGFAESVALEERTQNAMAGTAGWVANVESAAAELLPTLKALAGKALWSGKSILGPERFASAEATGLSLARAPTAVMGAGGKLGEGVARAVGAGEGALPYARAAGGFGAYEIAATEGRTGGKSTLQEDLTAGAKGLVAGAVLHKAQLVTQKILRGIFKEQSSTLGPDAKGVVEALAGWAKKASLSRAQNETVDDFGNRLIDSWIRQGLPGAETTMWQRLHSYAVRGGLEGSAMSLIDLQFWSDSIAAAQNGDMEAFSRATAAAAGNIIGMAASGVSLRDIPLLQRRTPTTKPKPQRVGEDAEAHLGAESARQGAEEAQRARELEEHPAAEAAEQRAQARRFDESGNPIAEEQALDLTQLGPNRPTPGTPEQQRANEQQQVERMASENLPGWQNLGRLGWSRVPSPEQEAPLPETPSQAQLNENIREQPREPIEYTKDDAQREFWNRQSKEFPEGEVTIEIGANVAQQAIEHAPGSLKKALQQLAAENGGTLRVTQREAQKFIDYHARTAPRRRGVAEDAGVEQSSIQARDSLTQKLVEAFGLAPKRPIGEKREGPPSLTRPQSPSGEAFRPEASREPERREGPDQEPPEGPGGIIVKPQPKGPKGGLGAPRVSEKPTEVEIPGTEFNFKVENGKAWASPKLEDLLGVDTPMDAKVFVDIVERASLASSLDASTMIAGTKVDASGVFAVPGRPGEGGTMRMFGLGDPLEKPLGPGGEWGTAKTVPTRGQDAIEPAQKQAVAMLRQILNGRSDWSQGDAILLGKAITLLDTVSARNDPAVAEALAVMPDLLQGLSRSSPQQASKLVKTLAEMLTTKGPDVALDDMLNEAAATAARTSKPAPQPQGPSPEYERAKAGLEAATTQFEEAKLARRAGEIEEAEFAEARDTFGAAKATFSKAALAERKAARGGAPPEKKGARQRPMFEGQEGFVDVGDAAGAVARATAAVGSVVGTPVRIFGQDLVSQAMERFPDTLGPRIFNVEANTKRLESLGNQVLQGMQQVATTRVPELDQVTWMQPTPTGERAGYTAFHRAKEADLRQRLGDNRDGLSERASQAVDISTRAHQLTRQWAADAGMHGPTGRPISRDAPRDVLTRQTTEEATRAIMQGEGRDYEAIVNVLMAENGMPRKQVEEILANEWSDARGLHKLDPVETFRAFRYFPDHLERADGSVLQLLETNPLRHTKALLRHAAARVGTVQEFGEDKGRTAQEGDYQSDLATPYRDIVNEHRSKADRELVATMLRAATGMPTERPTHWWNTEAGGFWDKSRRTMREVGNLAAALKMTLGSPVQNIVEPFATASAMLGQNRVGSAWGEAAKALSEGGFKEFMQGRIDKGGFQVHAPEFIVGGESGLLNKLTGAMRVARTAALVPFEMTQAFTDTVVHRAMETAIEGWREGTNQAGDVTTLKTLWGFPEAHARAVVEGRAPERTYEQLQLTALSRLTRRGDLQLNKSAFARSGAPDWVKFTGFFQRQLATYRRSIMAIRDAKTPGETSEALAQFAKLNGYNLGAYLVGQALVRGLGGWDEVMQFFRETVEDVKTPGGVARLGGAAFVGSMLGGLGSSLTGAVHSLFTGSKDDKANVVDTLTHMVPALDSVLKLREFAGAGLANVTGEPVSPDSPYSGKTPLQQIGYVLGQQIPAVRWAENGPFGLGLTYLGTDPKLEGALRAGRRWDNKNLNLDFDESTDAAFTEAMRAAAIKLRGKEQDTGEIAAEIMLALPEGKDPRSAAASLLRRRVLSGENWETIEPEKQQSKLRALGEDNVELLRGYDAVLERTADFFRPFSWR